MQTFTRMVPSHIKISAAGMKAFIPVILVDGKNYSMGGRCGQKTHIEARKMAKDAIELIESGTGTLADFQSGALIWAIDRKNNRVPSNVWVITHAVNETVYLFGNPIQGHESDPRDYALCYVDKASAENDLCNNFPNPEELKATLMDVNLVMLACNSVENAGFALFYPDDTAGLFYP